MKKILLLVFLYLIISSDFYAQNKIFGYRLSGETDILSDVISIQSGTKLDSIINFITREIVYRFEYYPDGKLKSDYNYMRFQELIDGRSKTFPGYRIYYYNERGDVDSTSAFYWSDTGRVDLSGSKINYVYDNNGRILSKTYSGIYGVTKIIENTYDDVGNLILNLQILPQYNDTTYNIWEYDLYNRLTLKKSVTDLKPFPHWIQYVYEYDSDENITCIEQAINYSTEYPLQLLTKYDFEFDQEGKLIHHTQYDIFDLSDSTWKYAVDVPITYDNNNRILKLGDHDLNLFYYNSSGNIDSLYFLHQGSGGYLSDRATLVDDDGNEITLLNNSGRYYFFYSDFITGIEKENNIDINFSLSQNYPNPFNPVTNISFSISQKDYVVIKIYDALGNEIRTLLNKLENPGKHEIIFDSSELASGVYYYSIKAGDFFKVRKLILLK